MIVGVDIDGILRNLVKGIEIAYQRIYPNRKPKAVTNWELELFFPEGPGIYDFVFRDHVEMCHRLSPPYPGAYNFCLELVRIPEVQMLLATNQPNRVSIRETWSWIEKHLPMDEIGGVLFLGDVSKTVVRFDWLLEDHGPTVSEALHRMKAVCMDRPWNQEHDVPRIDSYEQFLNMLRVEHGLMKR